MKPCRLVVILLVLGAFLLLPPAHASNTIRLKNGTTIMGVIEKMDGEVVIIRTSYGLLRIPESELLDIGTSGRAAAKQDPPENRTLENFYTHIYAGLGSLLNPASDGYAWPSFDISLQVVWPLDTGGRWQIGLGIGYFLLSSDSDYGAAFFEFAVALRFYLRHAADGLYLPAGLGYGIREYTGDDDTHPEYAESQMGLALSFGIGYALPLSRGTSLAAELLYSLDTALLAHHRLVARLGFVF